MINAKAKALFDAADKETDQKKKDALTDEAKKWQMGGVLFDSITGALGAGNLGGTIARAAAPFVAQQIGEYFKKEDPNGKDKQGTPAHLLAHAILGAAVAAANGDSPLAGGISAAPAEGAAPILAKWLFPKTDEKDLTAEQKSTITSIVSLIGAGIGGAIGGDNNVIAGADAAQNAVDNNKWLRSKNGGYFYRKGKCTDAEEAAGCVNDGSTINLGYGNLTVLDGSFIYDDIKYPGRLDYAYCNHDEGCVTSAQAKAWDKKGSTGRADRIAEISKQKELKSSFAILKEIYGEKAVEAAIAQCLVNQTCITFDEWRKTNSGLDFPIDPMALRDALNAAQIPVAKPLTKKEELELFARGITQTWEDTRGFVHGVLQVGEKAVDVIVTKTVDGSLIFVPDVNGSKTQVREFVGGVVQSFTEIPRDTFDLLTDANSRPYEPLANAIQNPKQIADAIKKATDEFKALPPDEQARQAGKFAGTIAQLFMGVKGAVNAAKGVKTIFAADELVTLGKALEEAGAVAGKEAAALTKTGVQLTKLGNEAETASQKLLTEGNPPKLLPERSSVPEKAKFTVDGKGDVLPEGRGNRNTVPNSLQPIELSKYSKSTFSSSGNGFTLNGKAFDVGSSPIKIPQNATITPSIKDAGYEQVSFVWRDASNTKYEVRWHSRTPEAPATQGDTWIVTKRVPGNSTGLHPQEFVLTGKEQWTPMKLWQDAIKARQANSATQAQNQLLIQGHHPAN